MNVLAIPHLFLVQLFLMEVQNDLNITGTYATTNITDFKIVIDSVGTPDTFKNGQATTVLHIFCR